jgi:hypothetical protein
MSVSLEQRIAAVLGGGAITSADLADLIAATDKAAAAAAAEAEAERAKALDISQPVDLTKVHGAMERAAITGERLRAALPRLWARFDEITSQEYAAQWRANYDEVAIVRDALAAELLETYPAIVATISDLMTRIEACDREASRINGSEPSGEQRRLRAVELEARNLANFTRGVPSITDELKLPHWETPSGLAWPPPVPIDPARFAPVPFNRRYSADWAQVKEEESRAVREQQEREAAEREAKALENYRGLRWWERERA